MKDSACSLILLCFSLLIWVLYNICIFLMYALFLIKKRVSSCLWTLGGSPVDLCVCVCVCAGINVSVYYCVS